MRICHFKCDQYISMIDVDVLGKIHKVWCIYIFSVLAFTKFGVCLGLGGWCYRFPPFLLYIRCKSGVTFVRRSFRDEEQNDIHLLCLKYTLYIVFVLARYSYNVLSQYQIDDDLFYVIRLYFTADLSVSLSDLRKPILFALKCHFSYPKRWQRCALPSLKK